MLWNYLKLKMNDHLTAVMEEEERQMRYGEVILRTEQFSRKLTGSCYAILCHSELNTALALLACLAAGKPAVPLSYRYGNAHIQKIMAKIRPEYLITDDNGELGIVRRAGKSCFDSPSDSLPALIMCTSGTGGNPKGVMLSEANLRANLTDIRSYFDLSEDDRILIARPLYHCAALTGEFLISLICGVHIVFDSGGLDPEHLIRLMIEKKITVFCGTPTLLTVTARLLKGRGDLLSLRKVTVSGECITDFAIRFIQKGFKGVNIYHVYGLTEASPRVAYLPPDFFETHSRSVGFLLPSLRGKIVDEGGRTLPAGAVGELLISGPSIMMGYYKDQAGTARVLKDGWLHTGDLAVIDENGLLTIKGRKDDLIIYAGMNIYPAEIENALKKDRRVQEVLVYGIPDKLCGQKIGLKIAGLFEKKQEIVELCVQNLPAYACPSVIEWLETLPKNGSGKIIRGAPIYK